MINNKEIGKQIALLRKEKGMTGEKLAEFLSVSPQAISKWENGRCLPETSVLPLLSKALGCSVDTILMPQKLHILSAIYSDGVSNLDVTQILNGYVNDNKINIIINNQFLNLDIDSNRIKVLMLKFQTPQDVYYSFVLQNEVLKLDVNSTGYSPKVTLEIVGAYYGNKNDYNDAMKKMNHYDFFNWTEMNVNHKIFPSSTCTDEIEYLTVIYINLKGIYVISCPENEKICFNTDKTYIYIKTNSENSCILPDIMNLQWNNNMDCTWAGALYGALKYMGEDMNYERLMGISGACYRIAFNEIWDWSTADALVAFDYAEIAYKALGYEVILANRIEKTLRKEERKKIVNDINRGKPLIAMNLRIAPEWGIITGYLENGKRLLCRTYFDNDVFDDHKEEIDFAKQTGGYLEADFWPSIIVHFGDKFIKPDEKEILFYSLKARVDSMIASQNKGYYQGYDGYKRWIKSLTENEGWNDSDNEEGIFRRLAVNDYLLMNLIDARRCAAVYLKNSINLLSGENAEILSQISDIYFNMWTDLAKFHKKVQHGNSIAIEYNSIKSKGVSTSDLRKEEADLLLKIVEMEYRIDELTNNMLNI